jgi:colanic acid biosynthesis glycosyl transferase WcaI
MGGGATRAHNAAKGLVVNGCRVVVVAAFPHYPTGNTPESYRWKPFHLEKSEGMTIVRTFVPPVASEGLMKRLILFMSFVASSLFALPYVGDVDVVWAANPNILSMFPASFYGLIKRKPVALNVDDLWPEDLDKVGLVKADSFSYRIVGFLAKLAYKKAKLITPVSPGYVGVICRAYGIDPEKLHVVRAGVDLEKFSSLGCQDCSDKKVFRVTYSGAFSAAYDFDQVLLAAKALEGVRDVEFVLQGGGELLNHVQLKIREFGVRNVKVINKIVSRTEVARLLCEADALLLPLKDFGEPYLGISSKLYEYQAVGKPIICCAIGQPAELVKKTESGIVVTPGDSESLAKAILHLKEDRVQGIALGENGRRYAETNVSIEIIGKKLSSSFSNYAKLKHQKSKHPPRIEIGKTHSETAKQARE